MFKLKKLALTLSLILSISAIPFNTFAEKADPNVSNTNPPVSSENNNPNTGETDGTKADPEKDKNTDDNKKDETKKDDNKTDGDNKKDENNSKPIVPEIKPDNKKTEPEIDKNRRIDIRFSSVRVYNDRVEGYADNASSVKLLKNGRTVSDSRSISSNGSFTIYYDFVGKNSAYGSMKVTPNWSGYGDDARNYNYVIAVRNGYVENYAPVRNGNYSFYNNLKYNINEYTFYASDSKDSFNDKYDLYNLSDFTLEATNRYSYYDETYRLSHSDDKRDKSIINSNTYSKSVGITSAEPNSNTIKGYGADSYAKITVKDSNGYTLGTTTADYRGDFSLTTNRVLKSEEVLTIYSSTNSTRENSTKYTVAKSSKVSYTNLFTIDSKSLSVTKNGVTTTTTMDVAPYIKDGRTMLPLRYVAESLGYSVLWNPYTRIASFSNSDTLILVNIDSSNFSINNNKYTFGVKPEIKNDRINLPVAEIGKALGLSTGLKGEGKNIEWDSVNRTVKITIN